MSRRRPRRCSTSSGTPASNCLWTYVRLRPRAVPAFPRTGSRPNWTSGAFPTCTCADWHTQRRPPGGTRWATRKAPQDLRQAPQDAAGPGTTRRTRRAGKKIRPGLHSLLRARPPAVSSAMDRRNHRRSRRGQDRESDSETDLINQACDGTASRQSSSPAASIEPVRPCRAQGFAGSRPSA
jgi:hypothetical protein